MNPVEPEEGAIARVVAVIARGGVVAFPTETLYGLAADATHARAVERVFSIKGRDRGVAIPLIAADRAQVVAWVGALDGPAGRLADEYWPGPLTLVLPVSGERLAPALLGGGRTVAVRVSAHPVAAALARALGRPITSTSANRSGQPPTPLADGVDAALGDAIDLIVDAGPCPGGPPSTIVDVSAPMPRLVRDGAVPWERVLNFLRE